MLTNPGPANIFVGCIGGHISVLSSDFAVLVDDVKKTATKWLYAIPETIVKNPLFMLKMLLLKRYARKCFYHGFEEWVENLSVGFTVRHHWATLVMLNGVPHDRFFYPDLESMIVTYITCSWYGPMISLHILISWIEIISITIFL